MQQMITDFARFAILIPFAICGLYLILRGKYNSILRLVLAVLTAEVLSEMCKIAIPEKRPFIADNLSSPIWVLSEGSFFSGHTAALFVLGAIMWGINKPLSIMSFVFGVAVGYFRVLIKVHYPVDIVGGAFFGVLIGVFAARIRSKQLQT